MKSFIVLLLFTSILCNSNADSFPKGLVGYWKFDKIDNNQIRDYSGNNGHGKLITKYKNKKYNPGLSERSAKGKALFFDGNTTGAIVVIRENKQLTIRKGTICFWMYPTKKSRKAHVVFTHAPNNKGYYGINFFWGMMRFSYYKNGTKFSVKAKRDHYIHRNYYVHVAVAFDLDKDIADIYLNGEKVGVTKRSAKGRYGTDGLTVIGAHKKSYPGEAFNGELDEMIVYNRILSRNEIFSVMEKTAVDMK